MKVLIFYINLLFYNFISANPSRVSAVDTIFRSTTTNCNISRSVRDNIASYSETANKIIDYFIDGPFKGKTWNSLEKLVDTFGNRFAGTENLENAIDYIIKDTKNNNFQDVYTENVTIPYWKRNNEYAEMIKPRYKKLAMLGLGYSIATPPEGLKRSAIVVRSFDELRALPDDSVRGKIVVYNEKFVSYGKTVKYRSKGASEASKKGAVGALVRSITPFSLNTPHTGMQTYDVNVTKIPVAAITIEDAEMLWRLQKLGMEIVINLKMSATLTYKVSRNTILNLRGSTKPEKVVIVSGHIDSWDVGDGSMDDGGGAFISWIAPIALKQLNLQPKRTLRAILWTAEEIGLIGSDQYQQRHKMEENNLNFVMESDIGTFNPLGLTYNGGEEGECLIREILKLFTKINTTQLEIGDAGPDVGYWIDRGIPGGGLMNENSKYFWYHHSDADRFNVLDSDTLDRAAAFWTGLSYIVADMENDIPRSK